MSIADTEAMRAAADLAEALHRAMDAFTLRYDSTVETGEIHKAQVRLGELLSKVDIALDANGANCQMTVEVSNDGSEWHQTDTQTLSSDQEIYQYDLAWRYVRAYANQNLGKIEISAKGIE